MKTEPWAFHESVEVPRSSFRILEDQGDKLIVEAEVIHAGRTLNHTIYPEEELQAAIGTFTAPYLKPVLRHHVMWDDAIGRTLEASFVASCIHNKPVATAIAEITDPDAMQKVRDGRYAQISVGVHAKYVYCSICGADLVEEGPWDHEHIKGREYDGQVAGWVLKGLTFDEWSYVNMPADVLAGNVRVDSRGFAPPQRAQSETPPMTEAPKGKDGKPLKRRTRAQDKDQKGAGKKGGRDRSAADDTQGGTKLMETVEQLQAELEATKEELASSNEAVNRLEAERDQAKQALEAAQNELTGARSQIAEKERKIQELETSLSETQKASEAMLQELTQALAERLADYKIVMGKVGLAERDQAVEGLKGRSLESLKDAVHDAFQDWSQVAQQTLIEQTRRPGLANPKEPGVHIPGPNAVEDLNDAQAYTALFGGLKTPRR